MFTPKQPPIEGAELVTTVYNPVDAAIIEDLLRQADIPSIRRPKHGLDPLPVLAGFSVLGEEIYTTSAQADEAREIVRAFTEGGAQILPEEEEQP